MKTLGFQTFLFVRGKPRGIKPEEIKHDTSSNLDHANLDNALNSIAALFMVIRKIYGDGLISGFLRKPTDEKNISAHLYPIRNSNIFIGEILKSGIKEHKSL